MGDKNQPQVIGALRRLHYGPGPHPGTGTDQDVHGEGNGKKRPSHGDRASIPGSEVGSMVDWVNVQVLNVKGDEVEVEILSGPDISAFYTIALDDWEAYSSEFDEALGPTDDPVENAKLIFGLTESYPEAGYILPSGDLLDFSGASQGSGGGSRYLDHRDIWQAFPDYEGSGYDAMSEFMAMGNIRMNFSMHRGEHDVSFDIAKLPTYAQKRVMKDMTQGAANLTWDISRPQTGGVIASGGGDYPEERELAEMFEAAVRKLVGRSLEFRYFTLRIRGEQSSHRIDARDIDYGWAGKFKDEGVFTTPIEPKDGIIAMPKASRGLSPEEPVSPNGENEPESENEIEEVEKKSLMADIRRSFTELMSAIKRER
jgi:hypothetical protein